MKLHLRLIIVILVVAAGLVVQGVLFAYLKAAPDILPGALTGPLALFPMQLETWQGQDIPIETDLKYADDHFQRRYVDSATGQPLTLWMAYSNVGLDRSHHPEICFQVYGQQEELAARKDVDVDGHASPIQQMRFYGGDGGQYVYYWHYTIPSPQVEGMSSLQELYQHLRRRRASVTLQVFAPIVNDQTPGVAIQFVKLADKAMQPLLGENALRGSNRLPVVEAARTQP